MKKHNGLYWHKILIIDNINKAIMSLFVEVLLPWSLLAKGRGSQQPWSLIPRPSPEKLLGHPASPPLSALVLLHLEISNLISTSESMLSCASSQTLHS